MRNIRINFKTITGYAGGLAAFGIGVVGLSLIFREPPPPELTEEHKQSNMMREAIESYYPLTRDMVMAAPEGTAYPDAPPYEGKPQTMRQTFEGAQEIIKNTEQGQIYYRCDTLTYLRDVHKVATDAYIAAGTPQVPGVTIDLPAHKKALAEAPAIAPICKIR